MTTADRENPNRLLGLGMGMAIAATGNTLQTVAEATGVSEAHIAGVAAGEIAPSQELLTDFARAVGYPISQVYMLGEAALEHQRETRSREDLQRATSEASAESIIQAAVWLDEAGLDQVIEALQDLRGVFRDE